MGDQPKLRADCIKCKTPHTREHMATYLALCERRGKDPLSSATGGILCAACFLAAVEDMGDDDER